MKCILPENTDPDFCLAAEEYLLKHFDDDIFLLWHCRGTVVVGKHQNLMAEIDYRYVRENNIGVSRRISGGGTVFHDVGNINFTYIKNVSSPGEVSFKQFTQPIVDALKILGLQVESSGRNDLLINGLKISGNAEHIYKNRVLHHGTLLYNANLEHLGNAIRVSPGKYHSKAVQSNRSAVANIAQFLTYQYTLKEFENHIFKYHLNNFTEAKSYRLTDQDRKIITGLAESKFNTWEWKYGYSPAYTFTNTVNYDGKTSALELLVGKGKISHAKITGDLYSKRDIEHLSTYLSGKPHLYKPVEEAHQFLNIAHNEEMLYSWF